MRRFLLLLALAFPLGLQAQYILTLNDVEFSNGTITDYKNTTEKNIIIPRAFGTDTVFHIGAHAFTNPLTHVTIPNTVLSIGFFAFDFYDSPYPVSFEENSNIITIPMNSIGGEFKLPTHASPNFHGYIHDGRVYQPGETLKLKTNKPFFVDVSYTLTDDDVVMSNNIIKSCSYDFKYKHIVIPSTLDGQEVKEIGSSVFKEKEIFKVTYPSTMRIIGYEAFQDNAFISIDIPEGIKVIRDYAFGINWDNKSVSLPSSLDSIGAYSFYRNIIKTLNIPENVTCIGEWAFENNDLASIEIPSSVKRIGSKAFFSNELNSVTFAPNSNLIYIKVNAFGENKGLQKITLPSNVNIGFMGYADQYGKLLNAGIEIVDFASNYYIYNPYTLTNDDVVVDVNGIIQSCSCNFSTNVIIIPDMLDGQIVKGTADFPNGSGLFYNIELFGVKLPSQLVTIGNYTFYKNNLTSVEIPSCVLKIGEGAFAYNNMLPIALFESKKSGFTFTNWKDKYGKKYVLGNIFNDFYNSLTAEFIAGEVLYPEFYSNRVEIVPFESIQFYDASINVDNDAVYTWTFGDGETSNEKNPIHIYKTVGSYTVALNITQTSENKTTTHTNYINVLPWYTLQDDDVVVVDGILQSCSYNYANKSIIIPDSLDNQAIIGIGKINEFTSSGVFEQKDIKRIQLPSNLIYIGHYALSGNKLEYINIPDRVVKMGEGALSYNPVDSITLPSPTKVGYNFTYWYSPCGYTYLGNTKAPTSLKCFNNSFDYLAIFSVINYNINYYNIGVNSNFSPKTYTIENSITISAPNRTGYKFLGWFTNALMTDTVGTPTIPKGSTRDTAFYAKCELINYNITYHNVGTITNHNPKSYTVETNIRLRELNSYDSTNYVFVGWYKNRYLTLQADSIVKGTIGSLNLYAKWLPDGDALFRADTFSILSKSPSCKDKNDGQIVITSELFAVNVKITETNSSFTVNKNAPYTVGNLTAGTYHLNIAAGETNRNFIVKIQAIPEINSSVKVEGSTVSFVIEGGLPPYEVQIGDERYTSETGRLTVNHLKSGKYSAIVRDKNYCTKDLAMNFDVDYLNVYPNPIEDGMLHLSLPISSNLKDNSCHVKVFSLLGANLISKLCIVEDNSIILDVNKLSTGIYLIEVKSDTFKETKQFIVK